MTALSADQSGDSRALGLPQQDQQEAQMPSIATPGDSPPFALPDRIAVDARGYGWRVWDGQDFWSMVPTNPDNSPIPQPVTWFYKGEWIDKALKLASLLPDDLDTRMVTRLGLEGRSRLVDLVQTIKAAFDA